MGDVMENRCEKKVEAWRAVVDYVNEKEVEETLPKAAHLRDSAVPMDWLIPEIQGIGTARAAAPDKGDAEEFEKV